MSEEIKKEHSIMKRIIKDNGLYEVLLNDNEFIEHMNTEYPKETIDDYKNTLNKVKELITNLKNKVKKLTKSNKKFKQENLELKKTVIELEELISTSKQTCRHCDQNIGTYCEDCYQKLVSDNLKLQVEKNK